MIYHPHLAQRHTSAPEYHELERKAWPDPRTWRGKNGFCLLSLLAVLFYPRAAAPQSQCRPVVTQAGREAKDPEEITSKKRGRQEGDFGFAPICTKNTGNPWN